MTNRIFAEVGPFKLIGDSRGFTVPVKNRTEYWKWCQDNGITTEYQGSLKEVDLWYVKNPKHRMLALLRWL